MIDNFVKMPAPLIVYGAFFSIVLLIQFIQAICSKYMQHVIRQFLLLVRIHKIRFIAGIILVLLIIPVLDKIVANLCVRFYNVHFYTAIDFISSCGEGWFVFGLIGLFFIISKLYNKTNGVILANICLISGVYAGILNGILKFLINRGRPSTAINPYNFFHFFINGGENFNDLIYSYNSMPSGHTITVVAVVTPLILHTKSLRLKFLIILIPLLEMFSRVYTMNHWLSDVSLAAILGTFIGIACYQVNQSRFVVAN